MKYLPPEKYDLSFILNPNTAIAIRCPNTPNNDTDFKALRSFNIHKGYNTVLDNKPMTKFLLSVILFGTPNFSNINPNTPVNTIVDAKHDTIGDTITTDCTIHWVFSEMVFDHASAYVEESVNLQVKKS